MKIFKNIFLALLGAVFFFLSQFSVAQEGEVISTDELNAICLEALDPDASIEPSCPKTGKKLDVSFTATGNNRCTTWKCNVGKSGSADTWTCKLKDNCRGQQRITRPNGEWGEVDWGKSTQKACPDDLRESFPRMDTFIPALIDSKELDKTLEQAYKDSKYCVCTNRPKNPDCEVDKDNSTSAADIKENILSYLSSEEVRFSTSNDGKCQGTFKFKNAEVRCKGSCFNMIIGGEGDPIPFCPDWFLADINWNEL